MANSEPMLYYRIEPKELRIFESRIGYGGKGPLKGGKITTIQFPVHADLPRDAALVEVNLAAIPVTTLGYMQIWRFGGVQPDTSIINAPNGGIINNCTKLDLRNDRSINIYVTNDCDLIIDAQGYLKYAPIISWGATGFDLVVIPGPFGRDIIQPSKGRG
jgi:hypothetical protein